MPGRFTQPSQFHARENRKGRLDPTFNLFRNRTFASSDNPIDTSAIFSAARRAEPITFSFSMERGASAPNGIILELGSSTRGLAIYIDDDTLGFVAGAGATDDHVAVTTSAFFSEDGQSARIVCSVNPGSGEGRIWVNGTNDGRDVAATAAFLWADDADGAVGEVEGTVTPRVPAGQRVTLANLTLTTPIDVYIGQRPRDFS